MKTSRNQNQNRNSSKRGSGSVAGNKNARNKNNQDYRKKQIKLSDNLNSDIKNKNWVDVDGDNLIDDGHVTSATSTTTINDSNDNSNDATTDTININTVTNVYTPTGALDNLAGLSQKFFVFVMGTNRLLFFGIVISVALAFLGVQFGGNAVEHRRLVLWAIMVVVAMYLYFQFTYGQFRISEDRIQGFVDGTKDRLGSGILLKNNVDVYEAPKTVKYITRYTGYMDILNSLLLPLRTYDNGGFSTVVAILDRFLRYYESILLDTRSADFYDHMVDLRKELLNNVSFLSFNVPHKMIPNVMLAMKKLQAKTRHDLRTVARKCFPENASLDPPQAYDHRSSFHEMF
jgi:hypothetical protein